jgi:hypothetical protein
MKVVMKCNGEDEQSVKKKVRNPVPCEGGMKRQWV